MHTDLLTNIDIRVFITDHSVCLCILFFSYDHEINITAQKMFPCCYLFNLGVCLRVILTKLSDFVDYAEFINVGILLLLYNY